MDEYPVEPPRDLNFFINQFKTGDNVNPSTTPVNPSATTVNPSETTVNPSETTVNPSATTVNPSATTLNPSATTVNPSATTVILYKSSVKVKPTVRVYRAQHPTQDTELAKWVEEHRILTKSTVPSNCNGKGFDFMQEEDLKSVLKYLPKGTLLEVESFKRAVRYKQYFEITNQKQRV
jgi:hypothetical protein